MSRKYLPFYKPAGVAELADAHDSKSCGEIRAGSSPATGMKKPAVTLVFVVYTLSILAFNGGLADGRI